MRNNFIHCKDTPILRAICQSTFRHRSFISTIVSILFSLTPRNAKCQLNLNPSLLNAQDTTGKTYPPKITLSRRHFIFTDCELGDIIIELGKWYRIKVEFEEGSPVNTRLTSTGIPKRWSLERIVSALVQTGEVRLQLETDRLTLLK